MRKKALRAVGAGHDCVTPAIVLKERIQSTLEVEKSAVSWQARPTALEDMLGHWRVSPPKTVLLFTFTTMPLQPNPSFIFPHFSPWISAYES